MVGRESPGSTTAADTQVTANRVTLLQDAGDEHGEGPAAASDYFQPPLGASLSPP